MSDRPFEVGNGGGVGRSRLDSATEAEELPVQVRQSMHFFVSLDEFILISPTGVGEIGDTVVEMRRLEVEDSGKLVALVEKVPGSEVAVENDGFGIIEADALEKFKCSFEVATDEMAFLGVDFLVFLDRRGKSGVGAELVC